jgi:hypothetical protein
MISKYKSIISDFPLLRLGKLRHTGEVQLSSISISQANPRQPQFILSSNAFFIQIQKRLYNHATSIGNHNYQQNSKNDIVAIQP